MSDTQPFDYEDRVILESFDLVSGTFDFMYRSGQLSSVKFGDDPKAPHRKLRRTMLADAKAGEVGEFLTADFENDMVEYCDGAADIAVVAIGALFEAVGGNYQIARAILSEVARSNLSKFDDNGQPIKDKGGKVLKGPNYSPPRIREILEYYGVEIPEVAPDASSFVSMPEENGVRPGAVDGEGHAAVPPALRGPAHGERVDTPMDRNFTPRKIKDNPQA